MHPIYKLVLKSPNLPDGLEYGPVPIGRKFSDDDYGYEFTFAVVVTTLLINFTQLAHIKYNRDVVINKITIRPYWLAAVLLTFQLIECVAFLVCQNIVYDTDLGFLYKLITSRSL